MQRRYSLVVEGDDDLHVVRHLFICHGVSHTTRSKGRTFQPEVVTKPNAIVIDDAEGVENLVESLPVRIKGSDIEILGVVVDADTDLRARWDALRHKLSQAGFSKVPQIPDPKGTILDEAGRSARVGVWLMPDNQLPGKLEDFVSTLVPANDPLWPLAQQSVSRIPPECCTYPSSAKVKAEIHTWLAWQEEPGTRIGAAISRRYFDPTSPYAHTFIDWTKRLFRV